MSPGLLQPAPETVFPLSITPAYPKAQAHELCNRGGCISEKQLCGCGLGTICAVSLRVAGQAALHS